MRTNPEDIYSTVQRYLGKSRCLVVPMYQLS